MVIVLAVFVDRNIEYDKLCYCKYSLSRDSLSDYERHRSNSIYMADCLRLQA